MLAIHQDETDRVLRTLEAVIGRDAVTERLRTLERLEAKIKSDSAYAYWCFSPQNSLWLTLRGARELWEKGAYARDFVNEIPQNGLYAASLISAISGAMPEWRREKFSSDICATKNTLDVLIELDTALNWLVHGYHICWLDETGASGKRSAEFIASKGDISFAVECKTLAPDAGRRIHREHVCLFIDEMKEEFNARKLMGELIVMFEDEIPSSPTDREAAVKSVLKRLEANQFDSTENGVAILAKLQPQDNLLVDGTAFVAGLQSRSGTFSHTIVTSTRPDGLCNPVAFRIGVRRPDKIIQRIKEKLRDASDQLRESHEVGMVRIHLPEIDDFGSEGAKEFIKKIADWMYGNPERNHIFAVEFVSDQIVKAFQTFTGSSAPYVVIVNPKFKDFPPVQVLLR